MECQADFALFFFSMRSSMVVLESCPVGGCDCSFLVPLNDVQKLLLAKIFGILELQMKILPSHACEHCFMSLLHFDDFLKRIATLQQYSKWDMHSEPKDLTVKKEDSEKHAYNCQCDDCQKKFGSLPLLAEVIEGQATKEKEEVDISEPSTSGNAEKRKDMKCKDCGKTFTHRGDMNKHLRKHSGEQPFSCQICNKKFAHTSNLARHLRVHSGERPFDCKNCGKSFGRKDKLQLHQKTKLCKKKFENAHE